jgi:hypothetical protein
VDSCNSCLFSKSPFAVHKIEAVVHQNSAVAYETRSHIGANPIRGVKLFTSEESVQRRNREAKALTMACSNNPAATTVIRI